MAQSSPFSLDAPDDAQSDDGGNEMSLLKWYPKGDATITYMNDHGVSEAISGLRTCIIQERSPLIAQAFEPSRNGHQLHLDCLDSTTAHPFIRYLYTGSYAPAGYQYEDVPTSLLLHCKMYRLADIYDLIDLKQQAQVNVIRQCEFGCSSPAIPIDLCKAIAYVYEFLQGHTGLIENIICYCVACFLRHRLGTDPDFQRMAYKLRPFQQDLCKESMKREFEDDTAAAIIQMPFEPYTPGTYASREDISRDRIEDVVYHFHGLEHDGESKRRKIEDKAETNISTLAMRLKIPEAGESSSSAKSNASNLLLALREKPDGKSRALPDSTSIKARRGSPANVTLEQLKQFEDENPVLVKMRQFAHERRGQTVDKASFIPAKAFHLAAREGNVEKERGGVSNVAQTSDVASSTSRKLSQARCALEDYQLQLHLLQEQNNRRLLQRKQQHDYENQQSPEPHQHRLDSGDVVKTEQTPASSSNDTDIKTEAADPAETPQKTEDVLISDKDDSDSDYELIATPAPVEEGLRSSDSESDSDTIFVDPPTPPADATPRPRTPSIASSATLFHPRETDGSSSDSEWDLI